MNCARNSPKTSQESTGEFVSNEKVVVPQAKITVRRVTWYPDRFRSFEIEVDGTIVGKVRAGESMTIPVVAGQHRIRVKIDWCGSETLLFEVEDGAHILFECGSTLAGWRMLLALLYITIWTRQYLWLRSVDRV